MATLQKEPVLLGKPHRLFSHYTRMMYHNNNKDGSKATSNAVKKVISENGFSDNPFSNRIFPSTRS